MPAKKRTVSGDKSAVSDDGASSMGEERDEIESALRMTDMVQASRSDTGSELSVSQPDTGKRKSRPGKNRATPADLAKVLAAIDRVGTSVRALREETASQIQEIAARMQRVESLAPGGLEKAPTYKTNDSTGSEAGSSSDAGSARGSNSNMRVKRVPKIYSAIEYVRPEPPATGHDNFQPIITGRPREAEKPKCLWSQNDRHAVWGYLPILDQQESPRRELEMFTLALVCASVSIIIVKSYPAYSEDDSYTSTLGMIQLVLVVWFTVEYMVRWIAVRPHTDIPRPFTQRQFWVAKLQHTLSFMAVVDLLSILPYYIELILVQTSGSSSSTTTGVLIVLRVVRVLRVFKLTRHSQTLIDFIDAMKLIGADLLVFIVVLATFVVLLSTAIYYAEHNGPNADLYPDIPSSMWWCVITITSVGYGDVVPATDWGKVIGAVAALFGVLLMNVPIAFVLHSFDEVYKIRKAREERAASIVNNIFTWADRHRKKITTDEAAEKYMSVKIQKKVSQLEPRAQAAAMRKAESKHLVKTKKERHNARGKLLDLILRPGMHHRRIGKGIYNGREHYLATKCFYRWEKITREGKLLRRQQSTLNREMLEAAMADDDDAVLADYERVLADTGPSDLPPTDSTRRRKKKAGHGGKVHPVPEADAAADAEVERALFRDADASDAETETSSQGNESSLA